jgi:hypothetical protein
MMDPRRFTALLHDACYELLAARIGSVEHERAAAKIVGMTVDWQLAFFKEFPGEATPETLAALEEFRRTVERILSYDGQGR